MGSEDEPESTTSSLTEGDHIRNPRDPLSIYLASQGFPIVTYVTWGKDTVSEMPRLAPFTSHPLTHQGLGSSRGLGYTAATLSHCFPPYLNVSTQNLKHLTNRLVREESLSSQSLLHNIHIPGLCSDQAYWAAQWGKESPAPNPEFSKLPDLLKFSPTHSNDPDPFSSPAWLFCMWSSTVAWCVMG